jgi:hypothetical protein
MKIILNSSSLSLDGAGRRVGAELPACRGESITTGLVAFKVVAPIGNRATASLRHDWGNPCAGQVRRRPPSRWLR